MGGLCSHPTGCLAWSVPALEPIGFWVGPGLGEKMVASRRAHASKYPPQLLLPVSLCPCSESQPPAAGSVGDPPIQAGRSDPRSYEVTTFPLGFSRPCVCLWLCMCPPRVEFLPQSYGSLVIKPSCLQSQMLCGHFLPMLDPWTREPDAGLTTVTPVGESLKYNHFPVCGLPTWCV